MRTLLVTLLCALLAAPVVLADYVELDSYSEVGAGVWGFSYRYVRTVTDGTDPDFLGPGGTWTLRDTTNLISLGTPNRWPDSEILAGGRAACWTYDGTDLSGSDPADWEPETSYGLFDALFNHPSAHFDLVAWAIDDFTAGLF